MSTEKRVFGTTGEDTLSGTSGADLVRGYTGNDLLAGGAGSDTFYFGRGDGRDTVTDYAAGDRLVFSGVSQRTVSYTDTAEGLRVDYGALGGGGPDSVLLRGFHDAKALKIGFDYGGTAGADTITASSGDDIVKGLGGNDALRGGAGNDLFLFRAGDGQDVIHDFQAGERIQFEGVSQRTVSYTDTDAGLKITYGALGGAGTDTVLLAGFHDGKAIDFVWGA